MTCGWRPLRAASEVDVDVVTWAKLLQLAPVHRSTW